MKMDMEMKPKGESEDSNEGTYSVEQLDCMLEHYIIAKKIEADKQVFAMLKDYALSKSKEIGEVFKAPGATPTKVKSVKDLKDIYNSKVMADDSTDEEMA
jgi:hypothetical protein